MQRSSTCSATMPLQVFQYPQSDRRRCNLGPAGSAAGSAAAFSILNRIGGDATIKVPSSRPTARLFQYPQSDRRRCNNDIRPRAGRHDCRFQYPQSDRRRCNFRPSPPDRRRRRVLSVSSIGSEAMQRGVNSTALVILLILSVSSIGSEAMQLSRAPLPALRYAPFSILNRIGGDATRS